MTNSEIIFDSAIAHGIFTEEEAVKHLQQTGCLPLHTFNEWRKMGYSVRKGEKAAMVCDIWRMTNYKKDQSADKESE